VRREYVLQQNAMFVELFVETDPKERCEWFASLQEAIADHDKKFS